MRRIIGVVLLCGIVFCMGSNAWALPTVGDQVNMGNDATTPYTLTDMTTGEVYASFCLESQVYFYLNTPYTVQSVGDFATSGGGGAVGGKDEVSDDTKWLYAAYMSNMFSKIDNAATKVQQTIWYLEGESGGVNYWNTLSGIIFDDAGWEVVAVNLVNQSGGDVQSQLVGAHTAPVPEPATMFLLGTGLIGLAGVGRKRIKR